MTIDAQTAIPSRGSEHRCFVTLPLVPLNVSDGVLPQERDLFPSLPSLNFATLKNRLFPK